MVGVGGKHNYINNTAEQEFLLFCADADKQKYGDSSSPVAAHCKHI